jgi:hypothetical protein
MTLLVRDVQCTLARVATTTPLLSVSRGQPELRKLAIQYAARLVSGCVVVRDGVHLCSRVCRTLQGHPRVWQWLTAADTYGASLMPASGVSSWRRRIITTTQCPTKRISVRALSVDALSHPRVGTQETGTRHTTHRSLRWSCLD